MSKNKRKHKRKKELRRRRLLKMAIAVFLLIATVCIIPMCHSSDVERKEEVAGVWIAYGDFKTLGLYNQYEEQFRENAVSFFKKAEAYGINTVYFHVRAFRDAAYDSEYFPVASFVWDRGEPISYDPLKIMIELAHQYDMELHAWLNPYRNSSFELPIMDPSSDETIDEILLCVEEIIENYEVDGIHFDDYFYEEESALPDSEKKSNVNNLIRKVYKQVHDVGGDMVFGISPAGNTSYCESIGADVKTWLSEEGYIDYIIPQIYWTDEHTASWREDMFTDTLDEWCSINDIGIDMYIGLAAYKAGIAEPEDPGWSNSTDNLAEQVQQIRGRNCDGFVFFSASDFYREDASEEFNNYAELEY